MAQQTYNYEVIIHLLDDTLLMFSSGEVPYEELEYVNKLYSEKNVKLPGTTTVVKYVTEEVDNIDAISDNVEPEYSYVNDMVVDMSLVHCIEIKGE